MVDLKQYITESERSYFYRIKTLEEVDDKAMDRIEKMLAKYYPLNIDGPRKTILQKNPLDFINVDVGEVWIIDIETRLPASSYVLQQEMRNALNCSEKYVVVRASNEPIEVSGEQIDALREIDKEATEGGLKRKAYLNTDGSHLPSEGNDETDYYGNAYNAKLLDYLYDIQKSRKPMNFDPPKPLFSWLDMPKETTEATDFNAAIKDAPKPAYMSVNQKGKKTPPVSPEHINRYGNLDDNNRTYSRTYVDQKGLEKTLSRKVDGVRKEK